jgi:hypothetical protein
LKKPQENVLLVRENYRGKKKGGFKMKEEVTESAIIQCGECHQMVKLCRICRKEFRRNETILCQFDDPATQWNNARAHYCSPDCYSEWTKQLRKEIETDLDVLFGLAMRTAIAAKVEDWMA